MFKKSQEHTPLTFYDFGLNYLKKISASSKGKRILIEEVESMGNRHLNIIPKQGLQLYNVQENDMLRISVP